MAISRKIGQRLLTIKEELERKKSRRSELQGELNGLLTRLHDEFDVSTVEEAKALIEQQERDLEQAETSIQQQMREIERLMGDGE